MIYMIKLFCSRRDSSRNKGTPWRVGPLKILVGRVVADKSRKVAAVKEAALPGGGKAEGGRLLEGGRGGGGGGGVSRREGPPATHSELLIYIYIYIYIYIVMIYY